jgi:hypothetical protein
MSDIDRIVRACSQAVEHEFLRQFARCQQGNLMALYPLNAASPTVKDRRGMRDDDA